jgi:stage II sporulation protein P
MNKRKWFTLFRYSVLSVIIGLIALFSVAGTMTSTDAKDRFSSLFIRNGLSKISTEGLVYAISLENPYFTQVLPAGNEPPALSSLSFQFATGIKPGDIRSLLGSELPGFAIFDTEIFVAGEGTDYTSLPIESAPPIKVLMEEREVARENLEVENSEEPEAPPKQTTKGQNVVFIYQSHSYESYFPLLKNADSANSTNPKANMIAVGKKLTEELEQRGIGTVHDTSNIAKLLDARGWEHPQAYKLSREIAVSALQQNNNVQYLFDLHRDAAKGETTTATINGEKYARLMFVTGKEHEHYEENVAMANALHKMLTQRYPEISRGVIGKKGPGTNGVFNQDLSSNSVIIEVGGVDNSLEELSRTIEALAEVFSDYYWQAEKVSG